MRDLWTALIPALSLAIGIFGTLAVEAFRDGRLQARDAATRAEANSQTRRDRRETFELANLSSTYENLDILARATTRYHLIDFLAARDNNVAYASRRIDSIPGSAEADEDVRVAHRDTLASSLLLLDDDMRDAVREAISALAGLASGPKSLDQATRDYDHSVALVHVVQVRIAERIRFLYIQNGPI
jgi:hypothetical protein